MRLLLGVTSAAVYAGTRIAAGVGVGAVHWVLLHRRTQQRLPLVYYDASGHLVTRP